MLDTNSFKPLLYLLFQRTYRHQIRVVILHTQLLLAAYPSDEVNIPVLSVYGSNDKILNLETYNNSKSLMKSNFTEDIISGGNHGQFANCRFLKGDGNASINSTVQQEKTVNDIIEFVNQFI